MKNNSSIFKIIICSCFVFGFSLFFIFSPKQKFSDAERRSLKQFPSLSTKAILSGSFMSDFDDFSMDQFPLRNQFRSIKAYSSKLIFHKADNNKLYYKNGYLSKLEYPLNLAKIEKNLATLKQVQKLYLEKANCKLYYSIIPDKNFFLKPDLLLDFQDILTPVQNALPNGTYIPINQQLKLEDFYFTDQHWKQENIIPVAMAIAQGMNASIPTDFETKTLENPFFGTYYGQAALKVQPDTITYLVNQDLEHCKVISYNNGTAKETAVYNMKKASGKDPYEMFLGGADPLLIIENPNCQNDKELIIFRDSFSSSLAPLLVSAYSKITLIDLRYIQPAMIKNFVEFTDQDVLILYSTLILNSF